MTAHNWHHYNPERAIAAQCLGCGVWRYERYWPGPAGYYYGRTENAARNSIDSREPPCTQGLFDDAPEIDQPKESQS